MSSSAFQPSVQYDPAAGGRMLVAGRKGYSTGEVVFREVPFLLCCTTMEGMLSRFFSLQREELEIMGRMPANVYAMSESDDEEIAELFKKFNIDLSNNKQGMFLAAGFKWFMGVMKSNAHGLMNHGSNSQSLWALYVYASAANHSCDPNLAYRNENGELIYAALRDIKPGEQLTMTYVDNLYASATHRQQRILKQKLFICECDRCKKEVDPSRRIWCPHCHTKQKEATGTAQVVPAFAAFVGAASGLKNLPQFQMTQKLNAAHQGEDIKEWWFCTTCEMAYPSSVLPIALESTLQSLFDKLDRSFGKPDPSTWFGYANYLYSTSLSVLGPLHWLAAAANYLLSRFYVGVWNGGNATPEVAQLALKHGRAFLDFVSSVAPSATESDAASWASVLMRLSLAAGDPASFINLASKFIIKLKNLYGANDQTVAAYFSALQYLHSRSETASETVLMNELSRFSERSIRPTLEPLAASLSSQIKFAKTIPQLLASSPLLRLQTPAPWTKQEVPPPAFIDLATKVLRVRGQQGLASQQQALASQQQGGGRDIQQSAAQQRTTSQSVAQYSAPQKGASQELTLTSQPTDTDLGSKADLVRDAVLEAMSQLPSGGDRAAFADQVAASVMKCLGRKKASRRSKSETALMRRQPTQQTTASALPIEVPMEVPRSALPLKYQTALPAAPAVAPLQTVPQTIQMQTRSHPSVVTRVTNLVPAAMVASLAVETRSTSSPIPPTLPARQQKPPTSVAAPPAVTHVQYTSTSAGRPKFQAVDPSARQTIVLDLMNEAERASPRRYVQQPPDASGHGRKAVKRTSSMPRKQHPPTELPSASAVAAAAAFEDPRRIPLKSITTATVGKATTMSTRVTTATSRPNEQIPYYGSTTRYTANPAISTATGISRLILAGATPRVASQFASIGSRTGSGASLNSPMKPHQSQQQPPRQAQSTTTAATANSGFIILQADSGPVRQRYQVELPNQLFLSSSSSQPHHSAQGRKSLVKK